MKPFTYLLWGALLLLFSACEKEPGLVNSDDLIGNWAFAAGDMPTVHPNMTYTYPDFRPVKSANSPGGLTLNPPSEPSSAEGAYLLLLADGTFKGHNTAYAIRGRYDFWPDYQLTFRIEEKDYQPGKESEWAARFDWLLENMAEVQVNGDRLVLKDAFRQRELIFHRVAD